MSFTFVISTNPYKSGFQTLFPEAQVSMKMPEDHTWEDQTTPRPLTKLSQTQKDQTTSGGTELPTRTKISSLQRTRTLPIAPSTPTENGLTRQEQKHVTRNQRKTQPTERLKNTITGLVNKNVKMATAHLFEDLHKDMTVKEIKGIKGTKRELGEYTIGNQTFTEWN